MTLYPYQEEGRDFLTSRDRAYLADRMGLGKTIQAIAAVRDLRPDNAAVRDLRPDNVVVVAPASAVPNWEAEIRAWDPDAGYLRDWTVLSYSQLIRLKWKTWRPDVVILDEAHYVKSPSAARTRAALGLARRAEMAWLLSGTPMPNHVGELYPVAKALWPEFLAEHGLRRKDDWWEYFCDTIITPYGPKVVGVRNAGILRGFLERVMLRRSLEDVGLQLPPLRVDLFRLPKDNLASDALAAYEAVEEAEEAYTSTLRRVLGEAKAPLIARQVIEELADGAYDKVVVLYHHKNVRSTLLEEFNKAGVTVVGFGGESPQTQRQFAINAFQEESDIQVFLAQQTAAGVAINLTAASEIVLVEPAWSPEDNWQAISRIHRIGQDRPCRARIFAISGTLDESIMGTVARKVKMQREVGL